MSWKGSAELKKKERSVKVAETLAKEGEAGGVRWRFY